MHSDRIKNSRNAVFVFIFLTGILSALARPEPRADLFPLSIIHINDFHARFEPTDTAGGACDAGGECVGGYARTVYTVRRLLEEQERNNAIYLNAGDNFQGSLWYNVGRWNVTSQFLNMLPADAMTLGNHEFDHGVMGVVPFLETLNTPMLVANIDDSDEPSIQGKYKKSMILERNNRKIGVIGVIIQTTYDLANTGKLKFHNESESILQEASKLKAQGANIIIVLSHCGYDVDKIIAERTGSNIDVIVGSHSHTFLYTGDTPPGPDKPRGDYPTVVEHSSGRRVLIVQAGAYAKYVGNITVFFDNEGNVKDFEGAPIYMANSVPEDNKILDAMRPWKEFIDIRGTKVYGNTLVDLSKRNCDAQECNIGDFVCDAMIYAFQRLQQLNKNSKKINIALVNNRAIKSSIHKGNRVILQELPIWKDIVITQGNVKIGETRVNLEQSECEYKECNMGNFYTDAILDKLQQITSFNKTEWTNISIAMVAAGELYLSWPKGDINYKQVYSQAPFEAPLLAFDLQGKHLKATLEKSVGSLDIEYNITKTKSFLQVNGLKIVYNLRKPINERVVEVKVLCALCKIPKYEVLNETADYRVLATRYVGDGGYGFSIFKDYGQNRELYTSEFESLLEYVKKMSPLYTGLEKRITFV